MPTGTPEKRAFRLALLTAALVAGCLAEREQLAPPLSGGSLSRTEAREARSAYERGLAGYEAGQYEAALDAFSTVVERYPASDESGVALYWRGRTLYQLQRETDAAAELRRYLALAPDVPYREHANLLLANSLYGQRRFEDALEAALAVQTVPALWRDDYVELSRDLMRQLPRPRVEAVAARTPPLAHLAPFYLQASRWAYAAGDSARAQGLARNVLQFPELPATTLAEARRMAGPEPGSVARARIGFIAPTEGRFTQVGLEVQQGVELALEEMNAGRREPIELVTRATAEDPDSTAEVIRELARAEEVRAILGPLISEMAVPAGRAASEEGVPLVSPTATDARLLVIDPRVYTVNALDGDIGHTMGMYAVRVLERRRFAILAVDNAYGRIQADAFAAAVQSAGARVVARRVYAPGTNQFTEALGAFVRGQADAVFIATKSPQEALRILNQMSFYELHGLLPLGTDAWNDPLFYDQGRAFARGYFADTFSRDTLVTRWQDFAARYTAKYGAEPRNLIPAWGYDATRIAFEVLAERRTPIGAGAARGEPTYKGASGLYRITPQGGVRRAVVIHRIEPGRPPRPIDW
jgi:branched-chain amino acid transport system substrate-binding protein